MVNKRKRRSPYRGHKTTTKLHVTKTIHPGDQDYPTPVHDQNKIF